MYVLFVQFNFSLVLGDFLRNNSVHHNSSLDIVAVHLSCRADASVATPEREYTERELDSSAKPEV
jgi:hypothetical protein